MPTIDVPVRLLIDSHDDVGEFLVELLRVDGTLFVAVCPVCFALVPHRKLSDHTEALKH
jgi:hypothetical protein